MSAECIHTHTQSREMRRNEPGWDTEKQQLERQISAVRQCMATDGKTFKLCFSNISGHQNHLSWLVRTKIAGPTEEFLTQ